MGGGDSRRPFFLWSRPFAVASILRLLLRFPRTYCNLSQAICMQPRPYHAVPAVAEHVARGTKSIRG